MTSSSRTFRVAAMDDFEASPFDRQARIDWWDQQRVSSAKVMVVGAGAIGNETLKNLALLGVRNVLVVDFDTISRSNLSRTVLFRKDDLGKKKAEVAAQRFRELCLADNPCVDWFDGDVVWDLGPGIYSEMDLILGCLDNVETRFAVNRNCWIANRPWIDSGINELALHVTVYGARQMPCYECQSSSALRKRARQRYSCDAFKRSAFAEGKIPTVQVASAIASAIQVQEAMKMLCGHKVSAGIEYFFQGTSNYSDHIPLRARDDCDAHIDYGTKSELSLDANVTLRQFLTTLSGLGVPDAQLDFTANLPPLVISATCRAGCGRSVQLLRPPHRIVDDEVVCSECRSLGKSLSYGTTITDKSTFHLQDEDFLLDLTLRQLGVPFGHVLSVRTKDDNYLYYTLANDAHLVMPTVCGVAR